jgi:hypothetical protein
LSLFNHFFKNRTPNKELLRKIRRKKSTYSKKGKKRQGVMNNRPVVVKGKSPAVSSSKKK